MIQHKTKHMFCLILSAYLKNSSKGKSQTHSSVESPQGKYNYKTCSNVRPWLLQSLTADTLPYDSDTSLKYRQRRERGHANIAKGWTEHWQLFWNLPYNEKFYISSLKKVTETLSKDNSLDHIQPCYANLHSCLDQGSRPNDHQGAPHHSLCYFTTKVVDDWMFWGR